MNEIRHESGGRKKGRMFLDQQMGFGVTVRAWRVLDFVPS